MTGLQILGTGRSLPTKVLTNDDMRQFVDTSDEWITSRTGIHTRHLCQEETCTTLAAQAGQKALKASGLSPKDIGLCIVATFTPQWATPSVACLVQKELGLPYGIPCFDLNAACSGFLYALDTARALLTAHETKYALVIGAEQISQVLDFSDRSTCVLFGDGAGAAVVTLSPEHPYASLLGSDGAQSCIWAKGPGHEPSHLQMDGKAVFRFAVDIIPRAVHGLLEKTGLSLSQIHHVVCHQANSRILDYAAKKLQAPEGLFYQNIGRYGNTSAASIPICLDEMSRDRLLTPGKRVLCVGFGAGLTWGACLLTF